MLNLLFHEIFILILFPYRSGDLLEPNLGKRLLQALFRAITPLKEAI